MSHPETEQDIDPEAFRRWVAEYPKGRLDYELSEALAECVLATQLHDKQSVLTLKVKIDPGEGLEGELATTVDVTIKPAKAKAPRVTFFATESGGLSRSHPNYQQIPGMENH